MKHSFKTALAIAATSALMLSTAPAAHSQSTTSSNLSSEGSSNFDLATFGKSLAWDLVEGGVNSAGSSDRSFAGTTDVLEKLGFSKFNLQSVYSDTDDYFPMAIDNSITEAKLLSRTKEDPSVYTDLPINLERWVVSSPSMKRNIEVQVMLAKDPSTPAPMLYMLDGLSAPKTSGWLRNGELPETLKDENVTVVMPTQAGGTIYTDWLTDDPKLGRQKWETFLSTELPKVMESSEAGLNFNGKRAIGGLSMGAAGAIRNANLYPGVWDAAMGISGCYTTDDAASKTLHRMITEPRGGNIENMWGPYGTTEWKRHDVARNLQGLGDVRVYLSASDGNITPTDRVPAMESMAVYELPLWAIVEQGMRHCTKKLDNAMNKAGMTNKVVRYTTGRIHDWPLYRDELPHGWAAIKSALY